MSVDRYVIFVLVIYEKLARQFVDMPGPIKTPKMDL